MNEGEILYRRYMPYPPLRPYISVIFAFESRRGIGADDYSLIAPNGSMKLVIPYRNHMRSTIGGTVREHKESSCFLIGLSTEGAIIECDENYGNVCVEFQPQGAARFFDFPMDAVARQIHGIQDLLGAAGRELQERVAEMPDMDGKVELVQRFLWGRLALPGRFDPIADYAVRRIAASRGLIHIAELSEEMGYSRRYLLNKFTESVGLGPKELACIVRFNEMYKQLNLSGMSDDRIYGPYYDQSHFIKEFKRFTGLSPGEYLNRSNKLGTVFFGE